MTSTTGLEIAVIGMAGRFPAAENIEEFWKLLKSGKEGLSTFTAEELKQAGIPEETIKDSNYVNKKGVISRKSVFDAELFGYNARDAAIIDPQFAVFHEVIWEALERAGYQSDKFSGLIGIYAGASSNLRWLHRVMSVEGSMADHFSVSIVTDPAYLSTRVAHKLDLTGPALTTNTTCSTSLVNVHLACQGLINGECDIALAGGVSVTSLENAGYLYQKDMILSPDGSCRTFDAEANGTASGEGCGVLVLKRLEDAIADNDSILAVVKGSAINNDGRRKVGFTAPSVEGQVAVVQSALERAEVPAESISYVEAHGTATKLGDPIEISALKQAFQFNRKDSCAIGSVKSNIGHLGEAAGVAGAIKTILALQHKQIPASLHYKNPNPLADMAGSPFKVNTSLRAWETFDGYPRRAGVSSFGIGGTNAHIVLEESLSVPHSGVSRPSHMVFLSGNTATALQNIEKNLANYLAGNPQVPMADICYTLHVGRKDLQYRKAFFAKDSEDCASVLLGLEPGRTQYSSKVGNEVLNPCFLFPGQGSQYRGMGREIYAQETVFRQHMDACFAIAKKISSLDFKAILFASSETGVDEPPLTDTAVVQPLLFIFEYALARTLMHWGVEPKAFLGHSVGEYVAACLSGVFSLEDAIALIIERGRLVQSLPGGSMIAVSVAEGEISSYLTDDLSIAAINTPTGLVVAGGDEAVQKLKEQLDAAGVRNTVLHTSHAFHSHHLDPILDDFRLCVERIKLNTPQIPFLSNVTGNWISAEEATSPDYWVKHLRAAVRFGDCVATLNAGGKYLFAEVGPGNTLSSFVLQIGDSAGKRICAQLVPGAKASHTADPFGFLFGGLSQMFVAGIGFDWDAFYENQHRQRVILPTYPFEGVNHYEHLSNTATAYLGISQPAQSTVPVQPEKAASTAKNEGREIESGVSAQVVPEEIEPRLRAIWEKYLGVANIGMHDDLFEFGVDSLLSIRVITEIRETFKAEIALDTIFILRTIAEQAKEIRSKLGSFDQVSMLPLTPMPHDGYAPLSSSQRRMWIISLLESEHTAYNNGLCGFVKGMNNEVLERAFRTIIERHSILRTVYREVDHEPRQEVLESFDFNIKQMDISDLDAETRYKKAADLWQQELLNPIDLKSDLMLRVTVVKYDDETHFLMVAQHHICSDNWSNNLLRDELLTLCDAYLRNESNPLPPLPVQYIDYVLWQKKWLQNGVINQQIPYWTKKLAGIPAVHNLPLDHPRPKFQSYLGTQHFSRIESSVLDGLNSIGQKYNTTLFMTMQAAFAVLIGRYSGENDIIVGFPVANRLQKEVEPVIGFFVNTLVLRSDLTGNPEFADFLQKTKSNLLEAYAHSHIPFEVLVDEIKPERSLSYESISQIQLVFLDQSKEQGGRTVNTASRDFEVFNYADMPVPFSKYDLTLYFSIVDGGLSFAWEYSLSLFDPETIARMASNFETLLRSIISAPNQEIRNLPLLSAPELDKQFTEWTESDKNTSSAELARAVNQTFSNQAAKAAEDVLDFSLFYFASDAGDKANDKYRLMFEGAKFADANDFEAVWTPERHFGTFGGVYPNPAITASALASITSNVKIRAGSCVLPLHSPVRVAEDWSVIDNISGGRVGIGFAAGFAVKDFVLAPEKYERRREILIEDVKTVKALWRGDTVSLADGKGEMADIQIRPRPIQDELPVWVTTTGNVEAFRQAGRNGDNVLTHLMGQSLDELKEKIAIYRAERRAAGYKGEGIVTMLAHTFIAESEDVIHKHVKEPFKKYLTESVGTPQAVIRNLTTTQAGGGTQTDSLLDDDIKALSELAFQRYYQSNALLGTAERCLPLVNAIKAAGVNEIACLIDFGVDSTLILDSLKNLNDLRKMALPQAIMESGNTDAINAEVEHVSDETSSSTEAVTSTILCVHQMFELQAARTPDNVAVEFDGKTLTYAQLNQQANQMAQYLIAQHDIQPDQLIGLCVEPSLPMAVGMLAILKAGAGYVPIDPALPLARIEYMIEDSHLKLVLTTADAIPKDAISSTVRVYLDDSNLHSGYSQENPVTAVLPENLAYVMYTSGSTGKPKGVMVEHAQVQRLFTHVPSALKIEKDDVWTLFHSFSFDVSVWEIWGALFHGGKLLILPKSVIHDTKALYRMLVDKKVTILNQTPSAFYSLQSVIPIKSHELSLRSVQLAGEALHPKYLSDWFDDEVVERGKQPKFVNIYGPTEATVYCTYKEITVEEVKSGKSNIGRSLDDMAVCVLNDEGQLQPVGVAGELHLYGAGLTRGYLNRPDLTAEKFVTGISPNIQDGRWYKTGDLVRWLPNGDIEYLGRADKQVKVRGYRIELGEIETRLIEHPLVNEAAVLALGDGESKYLAAYVVAAEQSELGNAELIAELKQTLTGVLPYYMVPQAFSVLDKLPRNANGKLDREVLEKIIGDKASAQFVAPRSEMEQGLSEIWCMLLGLDSVSVTANFFEIGGQSLVAIRVINEISKRFNVAVESRIIFEYNTIETLAAFIEVNLWRQSSKNISEQAMSSDEEEFSI